MAVYRVKAPFAFNLPSGQVFSMHAGDLVDERHPAFKSGGRIYLEPVDDAEAVLSEEITFGPPPPERTAEEVSGAVETATASPGEKRSVSNPRRRRSE